MGMKKNEVKKIMGVKIQGNSLYFFSHQNRSKNKGIPFTFFAKYARFVQIFFEKYVFISLL